MNFLITNNGGTTVATGGVPTASRTSRGWSRLLLGLLLAGGMGAHAAVEHEAAVPPADAAATKSSKIRSAEDGWVDISAFLDETYGFVPILMPITEPAVGYGASGGLMFIDKPMGKAAAGFGRPNISAFGGAATENGTWGTAAFDMHHWLDDRLQTVAGVIYASVNLDFYGIGDNAGLQGQPLRYNLEPVGGLVQAKYRLKESRWWAGLRYALASTDVSFEAPPATPGLPSFQSVSRVGGLAPSLTYDSRDTFFTPKSGSYLEVTTGLFSEALGGDDEFQRLDLVLMHYVPLHPRWTLGLRADGNFSFGEVPFYLRPYVHLRGVQAMRYQGEGVVQAETEVRWQFWGRFSAVGFVGVGAAGNDAGQFSKSVSVVAGGTGFRYELARKYDLHMGLDVAFGPDEPVIYIQVGSAWMRP